ncbi:DUF2878 domain-containing protein [Bacillus sp. NP157]|nr:DUF2878 domain-containing protein [Bacillus sp. NP157]
MRWINFILYQALWFALVIGAAHGSTGLALVPAAAFVVWQAATANDPRQDLRRVALAVLAGLVVDGVPALLDWWSYASPAPALPPHGAPLWILALWACFATTIDRSLSFLQGRLWLAAALGAIGGPLAYLGAARGWQAVHLPPSTLLFVGWLAVGWGLAMPLLASRVTASRTAPSPRSMPK